MKRITVTVTDWQSAALHELSALDEAPISFLVRQSLNAMLPTQLELAKFLRNPTTSDEDAAALANQMDSLLARFAGGGPAVPDGDEGPPPTRKRPKKPPVGNTGVNPS